jgi:hypothetical protein
LVISLIQALYDPRKHVPHDLDYKTALADIEFFAISSQVYYLLKRRGQWDRMPSFFKERLAQKYNESLYPNILIKNQTEQLLEKFEHAGIPAIPLKGIRFAEKYFGHIGARGTSDIDLLIKTTDLEKAIACVKSQGYTLEQGHIPSHFHWSFSKPIPHSPVPLTVELHWDFLKESTSNLKIEEFWEQAIPLESYRYIRELTDLHTFYMICLHGWRHNLNSLKYFIDIIQMLHVMGDQFEYPDLFKAAATHQTLKRITRTLAIVYHYFPHLQMVKELPLRKKTRLWWDYKAMRNIKERNFRLYVNWVYYHLFDFDTSKHSLQVMVSWIRNGK